MSSLCHIASRLVVAVLSTSSVPALAQVGSTCAYIVFKHHRSPQICFA